MELAYVRREFGREMVLWGNIEASDLENLAERAFTEKVKRALDEGTHRSERAELATKECVTRRRHQGRQSALGVRQVNRDEPPWLRVGQRPEPDGVDGAEDRCGDRHAEGDDGDDDR